MKTWIATALLLVTSPALAETLVYEGSEGLGKGKHIVFIANDHEYRSEQSCPVLAKILAKHHGFRCTVLFGLDEQGAIKAGAANLPGLESLQDADMLFFFARFMNLSDQQAGLLVDYFERGGPAVGVRTSTHCFNGQRGKWKSLTITTAVPTIAVVWANKCLGILGIRCEVNLTTAPTTKWAAASRQ